MEPHLLSLLAHDIRNLATPIAMLLQVLRYKPQAPGDGPELDLIQQQVEQLILLADNLHCLHRLEQEETMFNNKHTPLRAAIEAAAAKAGPWLAVQSLRLEARGPETDLQVPMEERVLVQVLVNLLMSAASTAPAGTSVVLEVKEEPDQVAIYVNPGSSNRRSLGWQVTQQLVERQGGSVERGPELVVRLPR